MAIDPSGKRILLVGGGSDFQTDVTEAFHRQGHELISASGGPPAVLAVASGLNPDLLIVGADAPADVESLVATVQALTGALDHERRRAARLEQGDRLASLGMLTAGLVHALNNPLVYVIANLEYLREELAALGLDAERHGQLDELLGEMHEGVDRIRRLVRDLRAFSRTGDERVRPIDPLATLEVAIDLASNEIRHRARVVRTLGRLPRVDADDTRLGQVLLHLLLHAAQLIDGASSGQHEIRIETRTDDGGRAVIEVHTFGPGLPPLEVTADLPFGSGPTPDTGSGIGLSICHSMARALGGSFEVESESGAVFRLILPPSGSGERGSGGLAPVSVSPPPRAYPPPLSWTAPELTPVNGLPVRRPRILLIDDEPLVCSALVRTFSGEYEVVALTSGKEALQRIGDGERFDAILCDLMMPEVSGMEVYDWLLSTWPDEARKIIFLTGGAFTLRARGFLDQVPNPRVEKPFDPVSLSALIKQRLRGR